MKARLLALAAALVLAVRAAGAGPDLADPFALIGSDFKRPRELPETFFNPFKIQPGLEASGQGAPSVSNEQVIDAVAQRRVTGILYEARPERDRVIIGDQVFGIGDEIAFAPKSEDSDPDPLVANATVVLRGVRPESLELEVTPAGEAARSVKYPLRRFWRP